MKSKCTERESTSVPPRVSRPTEFPLDTSEIHFGILQFPTIKPEIQLWFTSNIDGINHAK